MGNAQGVPPGGQPPMGGAGDSRPGSGVGAGNYPPNVYGGPPAEYTAASPSQFDAPQVQQQQQMPPNEKGGKRPPSSDMLIDGDSVQGVSEVNSLDDDTVPTVFRWEHGCRQVYYGNMQRLEPTNPNASFWKRFHLHSQPRATEACFQVHCGRRMEIPPDQPTVADTEERIRNFIDVMGFKAYTGDREFEKEKAAAQRTVPCLATKRR